MQSKKGDKICCGCDRNFTKGATNPPQAQQKTEKV
jgi:hypothetical protein